MRPGSPVAYVPTAALVVRRSALEALDGFDEALAVGEDVDFVWRLTPPAGPSATSPGPSCAIRSGPGGGPGWRSATATARRPPHWPAATERPCAPAVVSPWTAAAWALVAAGQPAARRGCGGLLDRRRSAAGSLPR